MEAVQSTEMKAQTFTTKQQPPWRYGFWHMTFCTSAKQHMLRSYAG